MRFTRKFGTNPLSSEQLTTERVASNRIPSLDGIRGLAIIMVLGSHAAGTNGFPATLEGLWPFIFSGSLGVRIFFVLSGFLITGLLLKEERKEARISLPAFYRRRVLRILPVYFTYIAVVCVLVKVRSLEVDSSAIISAATFTTPLWGNPHWILFHTWSLSIEEQFYICWPLACKLLSMRNRAIVAGSIICIVPAVRVLTYLYGDRALLGFTLATQGDSIMLGSLFAIVQGVRNSDIAVGMRTSLLALFSICLVSVLSQLGKLGFLTVPFGGTVQSLSIAVLICFCCQPSSGYVFQVLNSKPMVRIGILSYSLYIWQQLILYPRDAAWLWIQHFPQNLLVTLIVAWLSYVSIESFFIRMKDRNKNTLASSCHAQGVSTQEHYQVSECDSPFRHGRS